MKLLARICSLCICFQTWSCALKKRQSNHSSKQTSTGGRDWFGFPCCFPKSQKREDIICLWKFHMQLHLQKIIKRALMIQNPRNSFKSCMFMKKLLFFLSVNIFKEHENAKNQVTLQICYCPAYFTHTHTSLSSNSSNSAVLSKKPVKLPSLKNSLLSLLYPIETLHKIFWPVSTAAQN